MNHLVYILILFLFISSKAISQEKDTYPARVIIGPSLAQELFALQLPQMKNRVPHLVNIEVHFGITNWYWTCNPTVAAYTMSVHVDIGDVNYIGFVMKLPNGGERRVSFEEAGISIPPGKRPSICDIKLGIEIGKFNTRGTTEIDLTVSGTGTGSVRWDNRTQEFEDFVKYNHQEKRYKTVHEIFSGLDPQVTIDHLGSYNCNISNFDNNFYLARIKKYIDKEYETASTKTKLTTLLSAAQNAESLGRIDEAIESYEAAYQIQRNPDIKEKIDKLKAKKSSNQDSPSSAQGSNSRNTNSDSRSSGNSSQSQHSRDDSYNSFRNNNYSSNNGNSSYRGSSSTISAREEHERREAAKRAKVDAHNDALRQQGNAIHQQSQQTWNNYQQNLQQINSQFDQWHRNRMAAEEEDDYGEREETRWERDARERKEREERERVEREVREAERRERERIEREAKEAEQRRVAAENKRRDDLARNRQKIFSAFIPGELPSSASRLSTNKIYFFVFTVPGNLRDDRPETYLSNVFAIGQYPDGTWPLKTLVQREINALTLSTETIHGFYTSEQEAEKARSSFRDYMSSLGITVRAISYAGKNADVTPIDQQGVKPNLDFWGNPINTGASQKKSSTRPTQQTPDTKPKLDFWGNPVKE